MVLVIKNINLFKKLCLSFKNVLREPIQRSPRSATIKGHRAFSAPTGREGKYETSRLMKLWYLSHRRPVRTHEVWK